MPCSLPAIAVLMGSLGWAQCYWCWRWNYNMYIPDPIGRPLCHYCFDRFLDGLEPPWQPDARARLRMVLQQKAPLPHNVASLISEFAREDWEA